MKIEIELTEKSIENVITYIKTHPEEIKGLIQYVGDELFDVLMSRRVMKKLAESYKKFNTELNYRYSCEEKEQS